MPVNLPTNLLRSFVAIIDTGSMLNASEQVFVTQSALSLQVKRLEELVQQSLFVRDGRRLALTPQGDILLEYARRLLTLHDQAIDAVSSNHFDGPVRIGMVQDFADTLLNGLLATFSGLHPDAQIYARVAGTVELQTLLERRQLDVILGFAAGSDARAIAVSPMKWYGKPVLAQKAIVPLAVIEKPCRFRESAIAALENAGIAYRIAVETPNLSTLKAAVKSGLAITCRTDLFLYDLVALESNILPALPDIACIVEVADGLDAAAQRLADLTRESVRNHDPAQL